MKNVTFAIRYMAQRQAIFQRQEHSFAKHAHFQDKQKYWIGMRSQE